MKYINLDRLGSSFMTVGSVLFVFAASGTDGVHWYVAGAAFGFGVLCLYRNDRRKKRQRSMAERAVASLESIETLQRNQSRQAAGAGARKASRGR